MIKQRMLIGTQLDCMTHKFEANQLKWLNNAMDNPNPFLKERRLRASPGGNYINFPAFLLGNLINFPSLYKMLELNIRHVLLCRDSITCHIDLKVGDTITIRTFLKNAYEQQATSNPIGFIVLESLGSLEKEVAFHCERIFAVRGGFKRG